VERRRVKQVKRRVGENERMNRFVQLPACPLFRYFVGLIVDEFERVIFMDLYKFFDSLCFVLGCKKSEGGGQKSEEGSEVFEFRKYNWVFGYLGVSSLRSRRRLLASACLHLQSSCGTWVSTEYKTSHADYRSVAIRFCIRCEEPILVGWVDVMVRSAFLGKEVGIFVIRVKVSGTCGFTVDIK